MHDVDGKVAFITGGSSGIGLGIARAFADAGMKVVIGYRTREHLQEALKKFQNQSDRVHAINVDVTDRKGMERAAAETIKVFGKVHVLVNNAGVIIPEKLSETDYKSWDWILDVNLNGAFNGIRSFLPLIQSHGEGGHVITTSSILGLFTFSNAAAYAASKFALVGMMEALRGELAGTNIGASVFCPGTVTSSIEESSFRDRPAAPSSKFDQNERERIRAMRQDRQLMMDPLEVGQHVLRGMRNNDLYILTHAEYEQIIRDRCMALLAAIPRDIAVTEARMKMVSGLQPSIYATERSRLECDESAQR